MQDTVRCCMITDTPVPKEMVVHLEGDYYFDLRSLVSEYLSSERLENPFTKMPLPEAERKRVLEYGVLVVPCDAGIVSLNSLESIGNSILRCLRVSGSIYDVYKYDIKLDGISLYSYDLGKLAESLPLQMHSRIEHVRGVQPNHLLKMHHYLSNSGGDYQSLLASIEKELKEGSTMME